MFVPEEHGGGAGGIAVPVAVPFCNVRFCRVTVVFVAWKFGEE
jgi:hypothetical protein